MFRRPTPPGRNSSLYQRRGRDIEDLVMWAQRLLRSPGYQYSEVSSPMLKRHLPRSRSYDVGRIRQTLSDARLDDRTFDYLLGSLKMEYHAACSAAA